MAENFIEPSTGKKSSTSNKKNFIYNSYVNDSIFSPYDGYIVSVSNSECGGNIKIKHIFDNKTVYSNLCGVGKTTYLSGQQVYKNKTIGYFGNKDLSFSILDKDGDKLNIKDFIIGSQSKNDDLNKGNKNYKRNEKKSEVAGIMSDLIKLPFAAVEKFADIMKPKKREKKSDEPEIEEPNDVVFEEIRRIKKLMK